MNKHKIVVFPELSSPRMRMRTSFSPKSRLNKPEKTCPMAIEGDFLFLFWIGWSERLNDGID